MGQSISVLALDAADYALLQEWECDNILLDNHRELETFSYTYDRPYTREVWTSVATGLRPEEHGVTGADSNWENPMLDFVSSIISYIPTRIRANIGKVLLQSGFDLNSYSLETIFDKGIMDQWPGVGDETHFRQAQNWIAEVNDGNLSETDLRRRLLGNTGKELGWLSAMGGTDIPIAGTHSHVLDIAGHIYCSRAGMLKEYYELIDSMVGTMKDNCDELVILSDHGMEVDVLGDQDPGKHSWRAFVSTTLESEPPNDVIDVSNWLANQKNSFENSGQSEGLDAPEDHLRDLGYL
jgi:hypothetical protein